MGNNSVVYSVSRPDGQSWQPQNTIHGPPRQYVVNRPPMRNVNAMGSDEVQNGMPMQGRFIDMPNEI